MNEHKESDDLRKYNVFIYILLLYYYCATNALSLPPFCTVYERVDELCVFFKSECRPANWIKSQKWCELFHPKQIHTLCHHIILWLCRTYECILLVELCFGFVINRLMDIKSCGSAGSTVYINYLLTNLMQSIEIVAHKFNITTN